LPDKQLWRDWHPALGALLFCHSLIDYTRQTVLITHVLDHKEYDKGNWKDDL
jgi:hypothetical protein